MLRIVACVLGLAALAIASGCSQSEAADARAAEPQTAPEAETLPPAEPKVELIAPGQEPRQQLALRAENGNTFVIAAAAQLTMEQISDGQISRQRIPVTMYVLNVLVKDAAHAEGILCEFVCINALPIPDHDTDPMTIQMMGEMLGPLKGVGGRLVIGRDGLMRKLEPAVPPDLGGMSRMQVTGMVQALQLAAIPLPSEPVGVGGQWKLTMPIVQNGTKMNHQATYTIHALTDSRVDVEVKILQEGGEQDVIANEALPMPMTVKSVRNNGTGRAAVRFDRVLPLEYSLTLQGQTHVVMDAGTHKVDLVQQVTSNLEYGDPPDEAMPVESPAQEGEM